MQYTEHSFLGRNSKGFHRLVYSDWGDDTARIVICVHGLTGNGHDFDFIAPALVDHGYRVIAIDLAGRGRSDFLANPMDYSHAQYCDDLTALFADLNINEPQSVDWLGVSLGGLLGIRIAAAENSPIHKLILNDVGPIVSQDVLDFLHQYVSPLYTFDTVQALETRLRETRGLSWGPVTDAQWNHMAAHNARALDDGQISYAYDPAIAYIFKDLPLGEVDLWPLWHSLEQRVLLLHGAQSLVLTDDVVEKMREHYNGKQMDYVRFEDCGHVPSLMAQDQILAVTDWLVKA